MANLVTLPPTYLPTYPPRCLITLAALIMIFFLKIWLCVNNLIASRAFERPWSGHFEGLSHVLNKFGSSSKAEQIRSCEETRSVIR